MTTVYCDEVLNKVYDQKNRIFNVFLGVTVFYLVFCVAWLIYFIGLPYAHPMQKVVKACVFTATGLYVVFLFPFMGIKYSRVRKYYKMMYYLSQGLKITEENLFVGFAKQDLQKDYVDVISCIFKTWNQKKCEWMEREVYWDVEKELPALESGDRVRYVSQSNFLIQYEVVGHEESEEIQWDEEDESPSDVTEE